MGMSDFVLCGLTRISHLAHIADIALAVPCSV